MERDDLDIILSKRHIEPPQDDLAERIIARAVRSPQRRSLKTRQRIVRDLFSGFLLPQPALVLSFVLFLGVMAGMEMEASAALAQEDVSSFLYVDTQVDEDWL